VDVNYLSAKKSLQSESDFSARLAFRYHFSVSFTCGFTFGHIHIYTPGRTLKGLISKSYQNLFFLV